MEIYLICMNTCTCICACEKLRSVAVLDSCVMELSEQSKNDLILTITKLNDQKLFGLQTQPLTSDSSQQDTSLLTSFMQVNQTLGQSTIPILATILDSRFTLNCSKKSSMEMRAKCNREI